MLRSIVLCAILVASIGFSENLVAANQYVNSGNNGDSIVTIHGENGLYYVTEYFVAPGDLQDIIQRKMFETIEEARFYFNKEYKNHLDQRFSVSQYSQTEVPNQSLWDVKNAWNQQWEKKFNDWIEAEFDEEYFYKNNLATDCADAALALRWIFARDNNLPAANTLAGSGVLFTSHSMKREWRNLPRAQRWQDDRLFLAAIKYLMENAYTHTLLVDTYPIAMEKGSFTEGTIYLSIGETSGHTRIVGSIDDSGNGIPIWIYSSTVPVDVRKLYKEPLLYSSMEDEPKDGGLVKMRWPVRMGTSYSLVAKNQMPTFSLEQYDENFPTVNDHFMLTVIDRLGIPFVPVKIIDAVIEGLKNKLIDRIDVVEKGYAFCSVNDCSEGTQNYENHSTPSRDKSIAEGFEELRRLASILSEVDYKIVEHMEDSLKSTTVFVLNLEKSLDFFESLFRFGLPSFHPEDTVSERWVVIDQAAFASLRKKMSRLKRVREQQVLAAEHCRLNQNCGRGTVEWTRMNSYDVDSEIKKLANAALAEIPRIFPNSQIPTDILDYSSRSLFFVSEPNSQLSERNGGHQKPFYVVNASSSLFQLSNSIFYVDGESVVDVSNKQTLVEVKDAQFLVDDVNRMLVFVLNESGDTALRLYDYIHRQEVDSRALPQFSEHAKLFWIGSSVFIAIDSIRSKIIPFQVVNNEFKEVVGVPSVSPVGQRYDFSEARRFSSLSDGYGIVVKDKSREGFYLFETNGKIESRALGFLDFASDFAFSADRMAISTEHEVVFHDFMSGTSCAYSSQGVDYPDADPSNYIFSDYVNSEITFLDLSCQQVEVFPNHYRKRFGLNKVGFALMNLNGEGSLVFSSGRGGSRVDVPQGKYFSHALSSGFLVYDYLDSKYELMDPQGRVSATYSEYEQPVDCTYGFGNDSCSPGANFRLSLFEDNSIEDAQYEYRTLYLESGDLIGTDRILRSLEEEWFYYDDIDSFIRKGALLRGSENVMYYIPEN